MDAKKELLISYLDSLTISKSYEETSNDVVDRNELNNTNNEAHNTARPSIPKENFTGYSKDDLLIQYCKGTTTASCQEFSTIVMDYTTPPTPWRCSKHNMLEFTKTTSKQRSVKADKGRRFNCENNNNHAYESTSFYRFSNPLSFQGHPVISCGDSSSSKKSFDASKQQNIIDYTIDFDLSSDSSSGSVVSEAYDELFPNNRDFNALNFEKSQGSSDANIVNERGQEFITYDIEISQATLNLLYSPSVSGFNDTKRHIYIYSIKPSLFPGHEDIQYYKIGRHLNIKHDNISRLKKCPMMQDIQVRKYRASMCQLKRTALTSPTVFMTLLRSELVRNNFTLLSQDENYCIKCYGSHDEWFSISKVACSRLESIHSLPSNDTHAGWPYLNALINKLLTLTS